MVMANPYKMSDETALDALEQIVDSHGLQKVVYMLEEICHAKADHIAHNWQDYPLADNWKSNGTKLGLTADGLQETD
jgi:hypothetical protein